MTTKTVNVTTGKVLNYTISKQGYKTINGSKFITADETISVNMLPESSTDGVYVFGDRIGGCATFFTYFDSINPNTQEAQKYAVFVLDATYRNSGASWGTMNEDTVLPNYYTDYYNDWTSAYNAKESATFNTQAILDNYTVSSSSYQAFYYAKNPNGNSLIINVNGNNYSPELPNTFEVATLLNYTAQLDALDPTLINGTGTISLEGLKTNGSIWTSNELSSQKSYGYDYTGYRNMSKGTNCGIVPVFEIPVN